MTKKNKKKQQQNMLGLVWFFYLNQLMHTLRYEFQIECNFGHNNKVTKVLSRILEDQDKNYEQHILMPINTPIPLFLKQLMVEATTSSELIQLRLNFQQNMDGFVDYCLHDNLITKEEHICHSDHLRH